MIEFSSQVCYIVRTEREGYRCSSVEDLRELDGVENFVVEVSLPFEKPKIEEKYEKFEDLLYDLEDTEEVRDDSFLRELIRTLEIKALEVTYESKEGNLVRTILLDKVRKAYQNYFHRLKIDETEKAKIYFAIAELLMRENVGEGFARLVDENEVNFNDLKDYKLKYQVMKMNNPPFRLVEFIDSFRLRRFSDSRELLKHLYSIFSFCGKKYRMEGDFSRRIEEAHRIIYKILSKS